LLKNNRQRFPVVHGFCLPRTTGDVIQVVPTVSRPFRVALAQVGLPEFHSLEIVLCYARQERQHVLVNAL
jgi:hypothetical protein